MNTLKKTNFVRTIRSRHMFLAAAATALLMPAARADTYSFSLMAGGGVDLQNVDGGAGNARFFNPTSLAMDAAGNIYVADGGNHTVRKISPGGNTVTLAGSSGQAGTNDGTGSGARFQYPYGVAVDAGGNVYVTDIGANNIRKITPGGSVSTIAGIAGVAGSADGGAGVAQFNGPEGIAVDAAGTIYVADTNNSTIRRIPQNGAVTTWVGAAGQTGTADDAGGNARFNFPTGVAVDTAGNVYVADFANSSIRKVTAGGNVTTFAGFSGVSGANDGGGTGARFDHPSSIAVDAAGNVYVADTSNQTIRRITTSGNVSTLAGGAALGGSVNGQGGTARFFYPFGIAVDSGGTSIYVADTGNHTIRAVTAGGSVSTYAGTAAASGTADGSGAAARFAYPAGIAVDGAGTVYVADHGNNAIRRVDSGGAVSTLAGGGISGSADGAGAAAHFSGPTGVAVDGSGNIYVADADNNTIRKIANGTVSTFAGASGQTGGNDGTGAGARFNKPQGVAVDGTGNVYVADTNNNTIRKITPAGVVTTLAGSPGQTGSIDGAGASARFTGPYALAVGSDGSVYVADFFNSTIRKITATGTVSTLAGFPGQSGAADGIGGAARFNQPYALAVDGSGNVYVADTYNRSIRRIGANGVTTLAGSQTQFYYPQGLAMDGAGNIYVADGDNQSIFRGGLVLPPPSGSAVASASVTAGQNAIFSLSNPTNGATFQWQVSADGGTTWTSLGNDATYSGTNTVSLAISGATTALNGRRYRVLSSNAAGTGASAVATLTVADAPPPPPPTGGGTTGSARIGGLAVRAFAGSGSNMLTIGLSIIGGTSKQMIVRGVGPGLTAFGVGGALSTPSLSLFNTAGVAIQSNAGWGTASNAASMPAAFAAVGDFALTTGSADCAILQTLATGNYTAQISGMNGSTGIAMAEFYDADSGDPASRLRAVATLAQVGTDTNALTAGLSIKGTGALSVLIRGTGPGLAKLGIGGGLAAPVLTVFDAAHAVVATNTGWGGSATLSNAFAQVGLSPFTVGSNDCALILTLPAGTYTVQLAGVNNTTGLGLVEVYEMP